MFNVLVTAHLLYAFAARIPARAALREMLPSWPLLLAVGMGLGLQLLIATWPAAQGLFGGARLGPREWALAVAAGIIPALFIAAERSSALPTGGDARNA
jgi:magnesium-transporting ATPase (P-type)